MKLPVYKMSVPTEDDEFGVLAVALVDDPAILVNFQTFADLKPIKFSADTEKKIISGPLMIPNLPIYRRDEQYGEHYVVFDAPTILQLAIRFFKKGLANEVNEMHDPGKKVEGVTMFEAFFLNKERGTNTPAGYDELPDGTWWGSYKVDNPDIWAEVKAGAFKGFSVEGLFSQSYYKSEDEALVEAIVEALT